MSGDFELARPGHLYSAVVCPNANCRYAGPAAKIRKGSWLLLLLYLVLCFPVGIVYLFVCCHNLYVCPICRTTVGKMME